MSLANRIAAELRGDRVIWMIVTVLAVFSTLAVYSSSGTLAFKEQHNMSTEGYLLKHLLVLFFSLFILYLVHLMHYMRFSQLAPYLLIIAIPLLVATLAFGANINEAKRWLEVPIIGLTFQTSDFARVALITYIARALSTKQEYIKDFQSAFLPIIVPILIICGLIAPADLSTAMIIFTVGLLMMFVGRVDMKYIFLLVFSGIVVFAFLLVISQFAPDIVPRVDTWTSRVSEFVNNNDGTYQTVQAKIAIAQGGIIGNGPGNSTQRNFLPSAFADYIYAIIIEEYGLILGGFLIMALYLMLFFRCVSLVTKSPKTFGAMLVMGLSLNIVIQALANMAVSVHLVPVTGLTLPGISMGGTSIMITYIQLGMILSVSKFIEKIT